MASDLLTKIGTEVDARLGELRPLVREYERLRAAAESLGTAQSTADAPVRAKARAQKTSAKKPATKKTPAKKTTAKPPVATRAPATRAKRASRSSAAGAIEQAATGSSKAKRARKASQRKPIGHHEQAVLDALEHGSHTVGELVMVTAMGAKEIRGGIRRLLSDKGIQKVDRGGKTAYALPSASSK